MRKSFPILVAVGILPALVVLPTVSLPTAAPHPVSPHVQSVPLTGVDRAVWRRLGSPADTAVLTPELGTGPFTLVGVTWPHRSSTTGMTITVRVRGDSGWNAWQDLAVSNDGPDQGSQDQAGGRMGTEPLIMDQPSDGVQVRVDTPAGLAPTGLRLELVNPGQSPADAAIGATPPGAANAVATQPQIITRAQWGADESLRNSSPRYSSTVKVGIVHHTVTSNTYSPAQAAAQVRAIYAYDTNGLGWSDIAYNFLVDRFGRIYEGRAGGITKAVIAAHTAGFNQETVGVSALGCFDSSCSSKLGGPISPPAAMVDSIAAVLGWKLGLFYRDPTGTAVLTSSGTGGTNDQYPKGTQVTTDVVSGHRDHNATACPGSLLYPLVHTVIRDEAVAYQGAMLFNPSVSSTTSTWGSVRYSVRATVPGTQGWSLRVTAPGSATPVRTISGTASSTITATWDGMTDAGTPAPPGPYRLTLTSGATWSSLVETLPAQGAPQAASRRLGGPDRYATAVAMARDSYPSARTVVLVSGNTDHLVDGLVAAPLAKAAGGPVLLTESNSLPAVTAAEITGRRATRVLVVGGPSAVSDAVLGQVRAVGVPDVRRIDGPDRFATAAAVATEVAALRGRVTSVMLASGEQSHLIDAAAAGGPAAATGQPILLTTATQLPAPTVAALGTLRPATSYVLGSSDVVTPTVVAQLSEAAPATTPQRLGGKDRYTTAAAVASAFADKVPVTSVALASGQDANLVDSLAGGGMGKITLLTAPSSLTPTTSTWLGDHAVSGVLILGSRGTVSTLTFWAAAAAVAG